MISEPKRFFWPDAVVVSAVLALIFADPVRWMVASCTNIISTSGTTCYERGTDLLGELYIPIFIVSGILTIHWYYIFGAILVFGLVLSILRRKGSKGIRESI